MWGRGEGRGNNVASEVTHITTPPTPAQVLVGAKVDGYGWYPTAQHLSPHFLPHLHRSWLGPRWTDGTQRRVCRTASPASSRHLTCRCCSSRGGRLKVSPWVSDVRPWCVKCEYTFMVSHHDITLGPITASCLCSRGTCHTVAAAIP